MTQNSKHEPTAFRGYFIFILLTAFLGILALGFAIISLKNSEPSQAILMIEIALALMLTLFLAVLFTFKSKLSEAVKKERILNQFLRQTNLSKTHFIKSASHDIKNYVFGISGVLKFILQNKNAAEIQENDDLKIIKELALQSEELMHFVEDLFDTNYDESDDFSLTQNRIYNIIDLVQRMVILNKNFAIKNRVNLEIDNKTKSKLIKVECNAKRLKQVLNALIRSAIKRSVANDIVIIQISVTDSDVQISIIDQGSGISDEDYELSDPYNLNMPSMKKLIESDSGKLEIISVKGCGNEVQINLPTIHDQSESFDKSCEENSIDNSFKNKSVLIAEDNFITSKVVTFLLRKMGLNVKHVDSGAEILEQLDTQHFDLIFLDINMPKLGGLETAKIIREGKVFKRFKNYDIPIIAISTEKQELSDLKNCGINMMLGKPFSEKELICFVMEYVK